MITTWGLNFEYNNIQTSASSSSYSKYSLSKSTPGVLVFDRTRFSWLSGESFIYVNEMVHISIKNLHTSFESGRDNNGNFPSRCISGEIERGGF